MLSASLNKTFSSFLSFFYMHHPTERTAHTTAFVTPVVEHWLEREIAQNGVHNGGSIRRSTVELHHSPSTLQGWTMEEQNVLRRRKSKKTKMRPDELVCSKRSPEVINKGLVARGNNWIFCYSPHFEVKRLATSGH